MRNAKHVNYFKSQFTRIVLVIVLMFIAGESIAQQDPVYTQYMENLLNINPAYAGAKDLLSMMAVSRNQWVGMAHAPVTRAMSVNAPIGKTNMGLGLSFLSDQIWPIKQNGLYMDYSYTLRFRNKSKLALGLKAGINFYEANVAGLPTNDPNDPVFTSDFDQSFLPNLGIGAFYHTPRFYAGISAPKLIKNTIHKSGFSTGQFKREEVNIFLMSAYVFTVNRSVNFKPSVLSRFVTNAPVSFDINSTFVFADRLWLGAMWRLGDSVGGLFQIQTNNKMKIGYSYDYPISRLGGFNKGTHEIMVSFDYVLGKKKFRAPQYF